MVVPTTATNTNSTQLVSFLSAQITQLQGALAQAGTELSLTKVELNLLKSAGGLTDETEDEIVNHLRDDLKACQTELNLLRRFQSLDEDVDVVAIKGQLAEEFTNGICARVNRNLSGKDAGKTFTELNQELERKAKIITGLVADIEHLKVDLNFQQQRCDSMAEDRADLQRQVAAWQKKYDTMKEKLDAKEISDKHGLIDSYAKFNDANAVSVIGSPSKQKCENEEMLTENELLRQEVKTKDLALWLAHFENKKERKRKEIAELKVAKMSDRLQKLMFICERHRKEIMDLKSQLDRLNQVKQARAPFQPGNFTTSPNAKRKVRPEGGGGGTTSTQPTSAAITHPPPAAGIALPNLQQQQYD